ncbi:thermonuclease family protein [Alkalimarinus coralli]|uniref:thermonuclease family protein n=1 Tax=Alkalimarinus coralli TaxID=2935863 RepID=UPI00202AF6A0|nr:thermonuclease family protein [Alkalimarinus coralli]
MNRGNKLSIKRVSIWGALFLCLQVLFAAPLKAAPCTDVSLGLAAQSKISVVEDVVDGDTLRLEDGRKVRLIGINTPEIGRMGVESEPYAQKAKARLAELVGERAIVRLKVGRDSHDRYGRVLAHAFTEGGESIEAIMIHEGLGFAIAIPPNLSLQACLYRAQQEARRAKRGIWADSYFSPRDSRRLKRDDTGFRVVSGTLEKVYLKKGGSWWLLLEGRLAIMIPKSGQEYFSQQQLRALLGRQVVVSGWLIKRRLSKKEKARKYKPFMMSVKHPASFIEPTFN